MSKVRSGTVSGLLDLNSLCAGVVTFAPAPNPLQIIPFWRSSKTRPSSLTTNWDQLLILLFLIPNIMNCRTTFPAFCNSLIQYIF
jgi:hypothetical protein